MWATRVLLLLLARALGSKTRHATRLEDPGWRTGEVGVQPCGIRATRLQRIAAAVEGTEQLVPANFPRPLLNAGVRRCRRNTVTRAFCPMLFEGDRHGRPYKADVGGSSPSAPTPFALVTAAWSGNGSARFRCTTMPRPPGPPSFP